METTCFDRVLYFINLAACMVDLPILWRFPYVYFQSGGGTFLIPYLLAMFVCALPAILLDVLFCQFSSRGPGRRWIICPLFQGIGYGMVVISGIVSIFYSIIVAWSLYYSFNIFSEFLPWALCTNEWNTDLCVGINNRTNSSLVSATGLSHVESTKLSSDVTTRLVSSSEEYWSKHLLQMSTGIGDPGTVWWQLSLGVLGAWLLVFISSIRTIRATGTVRCLAVSGVYVVLISMLIRGSLLPGAVEGIRYYFLPQWEKLMDIKVWRNSMAQTFFSVGIGWGRMSNIASFNVIHNNCYRDALAIVVANCLTSLFVGFVVFMFLGNMANETQLPVSDVVKGGPGLAIMVYSKAASTMPVPQLCSAILFLSLSIIGLESMIGCVHSVLVAVKDVFTRSVPAFTLRVSAGLCCAGFILGLSCITQGGIYVLSLMDWYIASISVMVLVVAEVLVLAWIYGVNRLYDDLEMMIGYRVLPVWKAMWLVATPLYVIVLLIGGLINISPVSPGQTGYPGWSQAIGWMIALCPLIPIPVGMVMAFRKEEGATFKERLIKATKPRKEWQRGEGEEEVWNDKTDPDQVVVEITSA